MVVCCGEDAAELIEAVRRVSGRSPRQLHEYRCYRFWEHESGGLIWTGIGTGCLEPLLWEVLKPGLVQQLVLIGTAGRHPGSQTALGQAYFIDRATPWFSAVDTFYDQQPFRPRWRQPLPPGLLTASTTSTDFYYDLPAQRGGSRFAPPKTELVEMECAQFYLLCSSYSSGIDLSFAAIKGPANDLGRGHVQVTNSLDALCACWKQALALLASPSNK